jgi:hypothetical protein
MKKLSAILLSLALVLTLCGNAVFAATDAPSAWAKDRIDKAVELNLVTDEMNTAFQSPTTRAEFCGLVARMLIIWYDAPIDFQIEARGLTLGEFNDIADVGWPYAIRAAAALGIVNGTGNGNFSPNQQLTREQAATMLRNTLEAIGISTADAKKAGWEDESEISGWAQDAANVMYAAKIMSGTNTNPLTFSPKLSYTHEQAVITVLNLWEYAIGQNASRALPGNDVEYGKPATDTSGVGASDSLDMEKLASAKADEVIAKYVKVGMSDLDKERVIHDWIILNTVYDDMQKIDGVWVSSKEGSHEAHTAYGAIVNGRAVCDGFSGAMKLFMDKLGIECEIVSGPNHSWNRVKIGGVWYEVDLTYDNLDHVAYNWRYENDMSVYYAIGDHFDENNNAVFEPLSEASIENWGVSYQYFNRSTDTFNKFPHPKLTSESNAVCSEDMPFSTVLNAKTLPEFYVFEADSWTNSVPASWEYGEKERSELADMGVSPDVVYDDWGWTTSYWALKEILKTAKAGGIAVDYEYVYSNQYSYDKFKQHYDIIAMAEEEKQAVTIADFTNGMPKGGIIAIRYNAAYGQQNMRLGDDDISLLANGNGKSERMAVFCMPKQLRLTVVISLGDK